MGSLFDLQRAEMASILRDLNLAYTDRIGMHHTVEIRVPFLDNTVVDFALGLDARDVARLGTTKRVLREAMRGVLPKSVIRRRKSGFAGPVRAWMRNASRRAAVVRAVAGGTAREAGLLNPAGVRSIAPNSVPNSEYVLWSLLVLEVWMRLFVTGSALPSSRLSEVLDGG
jgi:asparagine synthase (glutamine-hydrolysing)